MKRLEDETHVPTTVARALTLGQSTDIPPVEVDVTAIGREQPDSEHEQRRLA